MDGLIFSEELVVSCIYKLQVNLYKTANGQCQYFKYSFLKSIFKTISFVDDRYMKRILWKSILPNCLITFILFLCKRIIIV